MCLCFCELCVDLLVSRYYGLDSLGNSGGMNYESHLEIADPMTSSLLSLKRGLGGVDRLL